MFQDQFRLTTDEKKGITAISLFVSIVYGQFWNEATSAESAPLNDAKLLARIEAYPNGVISTAASKALRRHLWYFSEHLIALAFFDHRVDVTVKKDMVKNLIRQPMRNNLRRLDGETFDHESSMDTFVTQRTTEFFDILLTNGADKASSFLVKDPLEWETDAIYVEMKHKVRQMKVVNDCAERGIALITTYNSCLTKDEEQKQYLL